MLSLLSLLQAGLLGAEPPRGSASALASAKARIVEGHRQEESGRFAQALTTFNLAAKIAQKAGAPELAAWAQVSEAACHVRLFQYRQAAEMAQKARTTALAAHANGPAGSASIDLATIYSQLGDFPLAETEANRAIQLLKGTDRKVSFARALLVKADILGRAQGAGTKAEKLYQQAISAAQATGDKQLQAMIWDDLGISLLNDGKAPAAETALHKAQALCLKTRDTDYLPIVEEHLAELNLAQKNYSAALGFINRAFASPSPEFKINPQYYPLHVRGEILLGLGRTEAALSEFRRAVNAADLWREGAMPGDTTATQTVVLLNATYQDFAELAASLAFRRHAPALSREAFDALARNRAASLREQLLANFSRAGTLPPKYFELLGALESEQARVLLPNASQQDRAKLNQLRVDLDRFENEMDLKTLNFSSTPENNSYKNSLRNIQPKLSDAETLLSFCLGKPHSFLWAVSGDRVNLYELPASGALDDKIRAFSEAIRQGKDAAALGRSLSGELFGALGPTFRQKREWLIVPDGALLDGFPFAALPSPGSGAPLAGAHTLRLLPSELLLTSRQAPAPSNYFVGVADPIYNLADPRWHGTPAAPSSAVSFALARLVGSGREIRSSAKLSGVPDADLLTGAQASGEQLRRALARTPKILHFAVHVVSPRGHPEEAALALSMTRNRIPELLTPETVASYRVPGTLVVMSGCASEQGEVLPSAGLIGLARAWLLAGASGVIVSAWPTPDDSGRFFSSFYAHLQAENPASGTLVQRAAAALAQAQMQMKSASGYRSAPSFWAAYSLISKE